MALGTDIDMYSYTFGDDQITDRVVRPVGVSAQWVTVGSDGVFDDGLAGNAGGVTNPDTQITSSLVQIATRIDYASLAMFRMKYDDGVTFSQVPIIQCFGRTGTEQWSKLTTKSGNTTATLSTAAGDVTDATDKWTTVDPDDHVFDLAGSRQILWGWSTIAAVSAGDLTLVSIELKVI